MTEADFKDYFSGHSSEYQKFRPVYQQSLYQILASLCPEHDTARDCATGNGQAAFGLSPCFRHIIATDASSNQLLHARSAANIDYRLAPAEHSVIDDHTVDLVTVAQALHWFDCDAFYQEVRRVLKHRGVIAVWSYNLLSISSEINQIIHTLYAAYSITTGHRNDVSLKTIIVILPFRLRPLPVRHTPCRHNGIYMNWLAICVPGQRYRTI
ncbi:MAG: class I SAM-dependent methyltransferase [Gammaproteobacteria bacterium]|nr:MAG: class I SAM-dependent methyltransferase [Gammaproteobacteria bacterium]